MCTLQYFASNTANYVAAGCNQVDIKFCFFENCVRVANIVQQAIDFKFTHTDSTCLNCGVSGGSPPIVLSTGGNARIARCCGINCIGVIMQYLDLEMKDTSTAKTTLVSAALCGRGTGSQATIMFRKGDHTISDYNATRCSIGGVGSGFCLEPKTGSMSRCIVSSSTGAAPLYIGYYENAYCSQSVAFARLASINCTKSVTNLFEIAYITEATVNQSTFRDCQTVSILNRIAAKVVFSNCRFDKGFSVPSVPVTMSNINTNVADVMAYEVSISELVCNMEAYSRYLPRYRKPLVIGGPLVLLV